MIVECPPAFRSLRGTLERRRTQSAPTLARGVGARATREPGVITGYAAVWYRPGDAGTEYRLAPDVVERIARGAFRRTIAEDAVLCGFNHNPDVILGSTSARTLELVEDSVGLHYRTTLPDTTAARDVEVLVGRRDVSGSSFAFFTKVDEWTKVGDTYVRTLREVDLLECGPVARPAYEGTTAGTGTLSADRAAAARRVRALICVLLDSPDAVGREGELAKLRRELDRLNRAEG